MYTALSLLSQGFIHCSTPEQYVEVANYLYKGRRDLVLLSIETSKVRADVRYEKVGDSYYPHIYGPLNIEAVVRVQRFRPETDGTFKKIPLDP